MNGMALHRILQLVLLHVGRESTSHVGWSHLRALGLAQEGAQFILQSHWSGKDSRTLLLHLAILLLLDTTTATTGLLNLLRDALLELLEVLLELQEEVQELKIVLQHFD